MMGSRFNSPSLQRLGARRRGPHCAPRLIYVSAREITGFSSITSMKRSACRVIQRAYQFSTLLEFAEEALVIDVEAEGLGGGIEVVAVDEERALRTGEDRRHSCLDPNQQSDRSRPLNILRT